jgi:hypothetical protein
VALEDVGVVALVNALSRADAVMLVGETSDRAQELFVQAARREALSSRQAWTSTPARFSCLMW